MDNTSKKYLKVIENNINNGVTCNFLILQFDDKLKCKYEPCMDKIKIINNDKIYHYSKSQFLDILKNGNYEIQKRHNMYIIHDTYNMA